MRQPRVLIAIEISGYVALPFVSSSWISGEVDSSSVRLSAVLSPSIATKKSGYVLYCRLLLFWRALI